MFQRAFRERMLEHDGAAKNIKTVCGSNLFLISRICICKLKFPVVGKVDKCSSVGTDNLTNGRGGGIVRLEID